MGISQKMRLQESWQTEFGDRIWREKKVHYFKVSKEHRENELGVGEMERWQKWQFGEGYGGYIWCLQSMTEASGKNH